jgi:predicted ester cyclase
VTSGCEHNKEKVRLFVQGVLNEGRLDLIDELVGNDYVGHVPDAAECVFGPQGLRRLVASRRSACPGLHIRILDQVAEADRVATRWQATSGARPAGEPVRSCEGISIVRLLAGKQVDSHTEYTAPTR